MFPEHVDGKRCSICDKKSQCSTHFSVLETDQSLRCNYSSRRYHSRYAWIQHGKVRKYNRQHKCDNCNISFSKSDDFKRHQRIKFGVKPYECENCNKPFSKSSDLKKHQRTNTGDNSYQCEICKIRFQNSWCWLEFRSIQKYLFFISDLMSVTFVRWNLNRKLVLLNIIGYTPIWNALVAKYVSEGFHWNKLCFNINKFTTDRNISTK